MPAIYNNLVDACLAVGVKAPACERKGTWIPVSLLGKKSRNDTGRVLFFTDGAGGIVHNWQTGHRAFFFYKGLSQDPAELRAARARMKTEFDRIRRDAEKRHQLAARRAQALFMAVPDENRSLTSLYCAKKEISQSGVFITTAKELASALHYIPHGSKGEPLQGAVLVLPIRSVDTGQICSLQFIDDAGSKAMLAGGAISGRVITNYSPLDFATFGHIGVAEGFATARSVQKLFDVPCVAALSCNNLKPACLELMKAYPWLRITVYGDVGNGSDQAMQAAVAVNGEVKFPEFKKFPDELYQEFVSTHGLPTDWNDWSILNDRARAQSAV